MVRLRQNVATIEARDREAHLQLGSPGVQELPSLQASIPSEHAPSSDERANNARTATQQPKTLPKPQEQRGRDYDSRLDGKELKSPGRLTTGTPTHDPWVPRPASDEPSPWLPRSIQRG